MPEEAKQPRKEISGSLNTAAGRKTKVTFARTRSSGRHELKDVPLPQACQNFGCLRPGEQKEGLSELGLWALPGRIASRLIGVLEKKVGNAML